ncbi:hypothetical protein [Alkaliphilus crotonatoxidans]
MIEILVQELYNGYGSCSEGTGNGARVFYRIVDGTIEILGKSSKANEQKVIDILIKMYSN